MTVTHPGALVLGVGLIAFVALVCSTPQPPLQAWVVAVIYGIGLCTGCFIWILATMPIPGGRRSAEERVDEAFMVGYDACREDRQQKRWLPEDGKEQGQ